MTALQKNNVQVFGKGGKALLFAHGYGCDQRVWRFVTPAFQDEYKIVLFDHVGSGNSDLSAYSRTRYSSLKGYADDVLELCHELALTEVLFVGHSVSAMIGVLAAIKEPALFDKLVLIGPSPRYINDFNYIGGFSQGDIEGLLELLERDHLGWSNTMARAIMGNPERPELGDELASNFCRMNPDIGKHFARVTFLTDNRADLPKLKTRALILQCAEDVVAPEVVGHYLHQHLAHSELRMMKATGHCPHLSAPEETIASLRAFL